MKVSPKDTLEAIARVSMDEMPIVVESIARATPNKVEQLLDAPHLRQLVKSAGEEKTKLVLEIEITKLASRLNVANNITAAQLPFVAEELLAAYPEESLQDFILCFRRIALGYYGKIYHQLDISIISGCMQQHIEEKAMYLERGHNELKKESDYPQVDYEAYKKRISEMTFSDREDRIKAFVGAVEYKELKNSYRPPSEMELKKRELHLQWISENIHPQTKAKLEGFKDETEWLLSKGYVLENGELKKI